MLSFFDNNITAVDLGSYETKIIAGKQEREGISVKKAFSFITPPNTYDNGYIEDEFKLAAAVREELAKNKISGGACHITVKSTSILTREILLPKLSGKDIAGLLHYQMEEHLPMDFSKYVIQHKAVERITEDGKEKLNVLVAAVPKELVETHYDFVRKLGLKPEVMDYQSNSIWKFL
ncbi:MAG TPA: pilus assembly protein PilM, partial [Candidatus Diapherotrites archaeon]|nr:pilus assembly protein PilM [Candidatus Diapherotrites archaeon]